MNAAEIRYLVQTGADWPEQLHWLGDAEAEELARETSPLDRARWLLGRWTAKRAVFALLARAGQARRYADIEVRATASGGSEAGPARRRRGLEIFLAGARAPMSLSLADGADCALAVVGPAGMAIGCHLERVEARSAEPADEQAVLGCLVWSAKQSARMALGEGPSGEKRALELEVGDTEPHGFRPVAVKLEEGGALAGFARCEEGRVLTIVGIGVMTPPVPLNADRPNPVRERRRGARTP